MLLARREGDLFMTTTSRLPRHAYQLACATTIRAVAELE